MISNRGIKIWADVYRNKYPILVVTGPRQSGKTTFLRAEFADYRYVSLENPDTREYAEQDTRGFLAEYDDKVIFDEAQYVPKLFSYLQGIVDENKVMGQFILSGSQNFNLMASITQSLAGRVAIFRLFPFDMAEMRAADWLVNDLPTVMTNGFYPAVFDRDIDPTKYYRDYIDTYVKRDISQLVNVQDTQTFKKFLQLCAKRGAQQLNYTTLARDAGVSHTTVRNWLSHLDTSYITFSLQPYHKKYGKRLVKSPKLYFYDTGLLCRLLNIKEDDLSPLHPYWGALFENMIVSELYKQDAHQLQDRHYHYWRDSNGNEVDVVYDEGLELNLIEIKAGITIQGNIFKGLDYLGDVATDDVVNKILMYGGMEDQKRTNYAIKSWYNL